MLHEPHTDALATEQDPAPLTAPGGRPPASERRPPPQVGSTVKHYELLRPLGEGGMGMVYLARDTTLGRLVAIKVLQSDTGLSAERFLIEAQATARCRHDNIVVIHEVDEVDGYPYMVLEYLEGRTLREWLAQRERPTAIDVSPSLAVELMLPVVRALSCAHKLGIVHRDLKPENIFLTTAGRVVVLDFGIAKRLDAAELSAINAAARPVAAARGTLTQEGVLLGTLPYMSPEQLRAEDIDARSDLWSVGIILFELLTGAHPMAGRPVFGFLETEDPREPMPSLHAKRPDAGELCLIVERCLAKARGDRYASADELLAALEALVSPRKSTEVALGEEASPFAGLSAFQEADAERFVGRDREVVSVMQRLRNQPLVVIAGPSGAGKSSFVRAGLIPALKRSGERWEALILRPGRRPLAALAELLAQITPATEEDLQPSLAATPPDALLAAFRTQPGLLGARLRARCRRDAGRHRIVLFVDQFEELYTLGADEAERAAFVACLEGAGDDASSPLRVVLSLRSDFLDRMAQDGHFLAEVTRALFFLRPMSSDHLREALTRPLEAAGYRFETEEVVRAMLAGLERTKSPLPLLQFTAAKLWEVRDRGARLLTQASYDQLGGVAGALSAHANAVLAALSASDQRLCRAVLLRLCTPERTRAVVGLADLRGLAADADAVEQVIHRLADARLVLIEAGGEAEGATVELCHESLTESWDKLQQWLAESEQDAQFVARLAAAAQQWAASGEAPGLLWRDRAAREAREWLARRRAERAAGEPIGLGAREERFLLSVIALSERARRRQRRLVAAVVATGFVIAAVLFVLSLGLKRQAAAAQAEARQARNATRMAAARELEHREPTTMLALLREVEPPDVPRGWAELASVGLRSGLLREVRRWDQPVYSAAWDRDGARVVVGLHDGTAQIWRPGEPEAAPVVLRGHELFVWSAAFSPDGTRIVTASGDRTARVWRADGTGTPAVLRGHEDEVMSAAFSPDGTRIVTASMDRTARIWRADGAELFVFRGHDADVVSAAFSPDGTKVVSAGLDKTARIWRADGAGDPVVLRHDDTVGTAAFSPDGRRVVTGSVDGTARVWRADGTGEPVVLRGHEHWVRQASFSPDGARVVTASKDKTVRVWNADGTGTPLVLRGHENWVYTAAFSPDGASIATASLDRTTRIFRTDLFGPPVLLRGHSAVVWQVAFSPDGRRLVTASEDNQVRIWRGDGAGAPAVLRHDEWVSAATFSPDSRRLVTGSADRTARIWSVDGSAPPVVLRGHTDRVSQAMFSPDGRRILTGSLDGTARLWPADGAAAPPVILRGEGGPIVTAAFSPDGARIAVSGDRTIRVWPADGSGAPLLFHGSTTPIALAAWSPDSTRLLAVSKDREVRVWRVAEPGAPSLVLRGHDGPVAWAAWSHDGELIATASHDRTARIWPADGLGDPITLRGHERELNFVAFSPDDDRLVTTAHDGSARIWNTDGAGVPYTLSHGQGVLAAAWSPDGTHLVTRVAEESHAWLWPVRPPLHGTDDPQLWTATPFCMSVPQRIALLSMSEARARADQAACERRVAAAAAAR